ncbi:MAG: oxygen-independent coproporphyrinogen III oxidase [Gammaproteobacteria bacterium]
MSQDTIFDVDLIKRYDTAGPRYTSYPTAVQFTETFGEAEYRRAANHGNLDPIPRPLSLYFHIPFCDTVCYYCACNKVVTKHRDRAAPYLANLHREIEMQAKLFDTDRKVDQLHWGGGTPTFISHDEMRALMAKTRQHFDLHDDDEGEYSIEIDPREAGGDTLALLRELGFNRLSLGVQDFDPVVQKAVNRIQPEEQTLGVLEAARENGYRSVSVDLIYGLPHQSVAGFDRTLDKIIEASPDRLSVFNYAHLPERFKPQRRINGEDLPSPAEKLDILGHTIAKLTEAGYLYIGMDHFAKPGDELARAQRDGTLYRNFQGYSTHAECDLVGMGITSIGMVCETYSQNVKTLEAYDARIQAGHLPVERGYRLTDDDLIRRDVITQLICHFSLDTRAIESRHDLEFWHYFEDALPALNQMADDGLLDFHDARIVVSPRGRLLIRNICMAFDAYLSPQQPATRFSRVI